MKRRLVYFAGLLAVVLLSACKGDEPSPEPTPTPKPTLTWKVTFQQMSRIASSVTVPFDTNIDAGELSTEVLGTEGWCTATLNAEAKTVTIACATNPDGLSRTATVYLQNKDKSIRRLLSITQLGRNATSSGILDDIKLTVSSGSASSSQSGEGIEKSYDGDLTTLYHSRYGATTYPITLTYNFAGTDSLDYIIYTPRQSGSNGIFKQFTVKVFSAENPNGLTLPSIALSNSNTPYRIEIPSRQTKVKKVVFTINSGYGDGNGFASCAEMEFFKKNSQNFDPTSFFTDAACWKLKEGVTKEQIDGISNQMFRELAQEIYLNQYDSEFRVQDYKSWQHPGVTGDKNKTSRFGLNDNPTGIYANAGEEIVALVDDVHGQSVGLHVQQPQGTINGTTYGLVKGVNKIKPAHSGLIYIRYYTQTGTEPSVKINFVKGNVNGYFDKTKHTADEWQARLAKAKFSHFDVVGEYAILTFETNDFRKNTDDGHKLISLYDQLVDQEQKLVGFDKYDRRFKNRAYFVTAYSGPYMYSTWYHTAYSRGTEVDLLNTSRFADVVWGPAHELGHTLQHTPTIKWLGMTECTVNIPSLYMQRYFNVKPNRLTREKRYEEAWRTIVNTNAAHNASVGAVVVDGDTAQSMQNSVFGKLVPFWQLKLYVEDALGKTDFYKDLYQLARVRANAANGEGASQLLFVELACEAANLDLTEFFTTWGFLRPINQKISDYRTADFVITQEQINATKARIAAKNYPQPRHNNIHLITDDNVANYK